MNESSVQRRGQDAPIRARLCCSHGARWKRDCEISRERRDKAISLHDQMTGGIEVSGQPVRTESSEGGQVELQGGVSASDATIK